MVRATPGLRTWHGPALALASVLPALLDQGSVDADRRAWVLISIWAAVSLVTAAAMILRPVVATIATFAAVGAVELTASATEVELSFLDLAPVVVCLFTTGALASRRAVLWTAGVIGAVTVAGVIVNRLTADPQWQGGTDVLAGVLSMAMALLAGSTLKAQRDQAEVSSQLYDLERQRRLLAEREASARERARIAREMHDLVAHSVTLLVVNAETMRARSAELPGWAATQADAMAAAGRRASEEMREMLSVLRAEDDPLPTSPVRQLDDVDTLVEEARAAGMRVAYDQRGPKAQLGLPASLCAYRAVQEGLSNARRHRPGSPVSVEVGWQDDVVEIEIRTGAAGGPDVVPAVTPDRTSAGPRPEGLGLVGLRERVAETGGTVEVAETAGAHVLRVCLPAQDARDRVRDASR
ncbi:hypothetical protein DJ010_16290 [Nocardioides silvaticus]|uniref:histidine kinase n=1 Tax=Nocardioides silvaticus TaxID=2201891 RepID=A0A316TFY5_9ACTN|nr:histidine kinase [Nocardioides silvaticus]PWN02079.1 hypothetical protein DJ010_16290 [Nocardioides silvaticus]